MSERVAVVTGAGQGIGRGIAGVLAARGLRVVVVDRHADRARATADSIGSEAVPVVADLLDEEAVAGMAAEVLSGSGRWDVLVNNAGSLRFGTRARDDRRRLGRRLRRLRQDGLAVHARRRGAARRLRRGARDQHQLDRGPRAPARTG